MDYQGDVILCPHDWGKKFMVGNMNKSNFLDLWNSQKMKVDGESSIVKEIKERASWMREREEKNAFRYRAKKQRLCRRGPGSGFRYTTL